MKSFARPDILRLFDLLNQELAQLGVCGELFLVGGAVMPLVHHMRVTTKNIDALFRPPAEIRIAAARVAEVECLDPHWLNDAVKGFLSASGTSEDFVELSHLKVSTAHPEYMRQ